MPADGRSATCGKCCATLVVRQYTVRTESKSVSAIGEEQLRERI